MTFRALTGTLKPDADTDAATAYRLFVLGPTPTDRRHHVRTGITIGRSLCLCVPELFRAVRAVLTTRR
jgi:hypothetical protein